MAAILMVSKPVAPPWNDSSKNLVRDLATHMQRHQATVMTEPSAPLELGAARSEAIYSGNSGRFAPALRDNARVFLRLLLGPRCDLWHFFFAPNPRSSRLASFVSGVRGVPTVQTVCSAPRQGVDLARVLFASRVVVLSRHTQQRFIAAGVAAERLRRIAPAVAELTPHTAQERRLTRERLGLSVDAPLLVYPGDLEFSRGASRALEALADLPDTLDARLVMACRAKTGAASQAEARARSECQALGLSDRVHWVGETPDIHALLGTADLVLLPAENLYAKMDLPLVLIEAMWLARAVLVLEDTPAAELAENDGVLVVADDRGAIAQAACQILEDSQGRDALQLRARSAAATRFAPAVMGQAYESLYDELLSS